MCAFHVKSPEIVTPKSLASLTNLMHSSPMTTGGKSQSDVKLMGSSLHLSVFNLTLFLIDQFTTSFTIPWASLCCPYFITSDVVVSSTYFQIKALLTVRSFIMIKKSQGASLVPCGTPGGTVPHSDTQSSESLILCERADRKSIIQLMTLGAMSSAHNFVTKILWSIRSNAFL